MTTQTPHISFPDQPPITPICSDYPSDYQQQAVLTALLPLNRLDYFILGLVGELAELLSTHGHMTVEDFYDEAGDCRWYFSLILLYFNTTDDPIALFSDLTTHRSLNFRSDMKDCLAVASRLCNIIKKPLRPGDEGITPDRLRKIYLTTLEAYEIFCETIGSQHFDEIGNRNLQKLNSRQQRGTLTGDGDHR
jgi:hypothetical protein